MRFGLLGRAALVGVAATLVLTACGGGSSEGTNAAKDGPEDTSITVGTLPIPDIAPLHIAMQKGWFKEEGLEVKAETIQGSAVGLNKLAAGGLDFMLGNYMSVLKAQAQGTGKFKYVADSFQAAPDTFNLMVGKDSKIRTLADLKGKKVALNTKGNVGDLAVASTLRQAGLSNTDISIQEIPFPNMGAALAAGTIDAAWCGEPYISEMQTKLGAHKLADTMTGPTADFPVAGWSVSESYATKNPKTVAAFQRAMAKAQQLAASDRTAVEAVLPTYTQIQSDVAKIITLGTFPTSLSAQRIQRVADLMVELKFLDKKIDVSNMIIPPPPAK
ncbi:ABC transporter substrate-binding protein [Bailinhaonella thermotolerans]|uniref:ABC transporter substrate-binding protein n=1 Tax=Bailinhaonella thermotolerans TaxID=1070861 RepID=A0A3A3ZX91_9ACTN|nr:ABC transporter substrate-binding protein [Bailinhaonella thermotolerans]RJL18869.1 ABC transporter substrate-binding protein [Bailinhaonella thermotolerans]